MAFLRKGHAAVEMTVFGRVKFLRRMGIFWRREKSEEGKIERAVTLVML
jgi:hypothetical protein